ncbi:hypothetical protein QFZ47_005375 [Variovorax paradoxus]|nr:hypothetical protein [Variovorax paradoxus]
MQPLHRIAVTVIEEEEGAYRWRLVELEGDGWHILNQQARSMKTYKAAMAAGLLELQKMVEDLDVGPREDEPKVAKSKKSGSVFGFGFWLPKMG